jgi:hypothetical protein
MIRRLAAVSLVVVLFVGIALAKDYKGPLKKVDGTKITVTVDGKEKEFTVDDAVEFTYKAKGEDKTKTGTDVTTLLTKRLEKAKEKGKDVTIEFTTKGEGDSEKVVKIKLAAKGKAKDTAKATEKTDK